jgi:hypothetical protein
MKSDDSNEKVMITCNREVMTLFGLIVGQNFEGMMNAYEKQLGLKPAATEDFKSIVKQMQNALFDEVPVQI